VSKVMSLRLKDEQVERLQRAARRWGRTPSEIAVLLLEESLRQRDFAFIEFRDSAVGRQAYLQGTRLPVWQVAWLVRDYGGDVAKTADHLNLPVVQVAAAMRYAAAYPDEIEAAIVDNTHAVANLADQLPNLEVFDVDAFAS